MSKKKATKYIVVTGGVLSGLGKGVAAASIGSLPQEKLKIVPIKLDGYLNTDPGTMNPIEHGEVFVLDDGGEVDMDFGHYERFIKVNAKSTWNITMGRVYKQILENEREGKYLGKTVQLIPHVTDEIKEKIYNIANEENADLVIIEIGGTIGDLEIALFVESIRRIGYDVGRDNMMFTHLTYVPIPSGVNEQKTKPTQASVALLNQAGIYPDMIIARCSEMLTESSKLKIAKGCNLPTEAIISGVDVDPIYDLPLVFEEQGVAELIHKKLKIYSPPDLEKARKLVNSLKRLKRAAKHVKNIAICGKYTDLEDSYASVVESLYHCSANLDVKINIKFIDTTIVTEENIKETLINIDGVIIPGGFGLRGTEGKIEIIKYLRENNIPFLGICLGMQLAVIEFARNVCGIKDAHTTEVEHDGVNVKEPVVCILPEQIKVTQKGGTMRLGGHDIEIKSNTKAAAIFNKKSIRRRFRHRYEINPDYISQIEEEGLVFSGKASKKEIMQLMELPKHKFFMAAQFHPELTSRLEQPSILFLEFIKATLD